MRKTTCLGSESGFFKKNLLYIGFVMMAVTIPFIYNNCGQAQFGVDGAESNTSLVKTNTDLCLSNQVAVGVDVNGDILCAQKIEHTGNLCPVGETLYEYDDVSGTSQCLKNCEFAGNVTNSLCPNGANLTSVGANNSVLCQSHPSHIGLIGSSISHYLLGFDDDSKPQVEVLVACPGTESELNVECSGTEELIDIIDGTNGKEAVCREVVFSPINALCPEGQAYIGTSQNNIVCQTIFTGSENIEAKTCSAGMYLDIVSGVATCKPLPQLNDSHVCASGSYAVGIVNGLPSCKVLTNSDDKFNGTCNPGQYIIGYAGGQVVCEVLPVSGNFNETCSSGTYPHAIFNNTLECLPYSYNQQVCAPTSRQQCAVNNGVGSRVCNANGTAYGSCQVESCFSGYELNNLGLCVAIVSEPTPDPVEPTPDPIIKDTTKPALSIGEKPAVSTEETVASFTVKAIDAVGVTSLQCRLRSPNGSWTAYNDCKDSVSSGIAYGSYEYTSLTPGTYIFRATAKDAANNTTHKDYRWTVRLTCEAGYKVSGGVCTPICGATKILKGNLCIDKYKWAGGRKNGTSGEKGERSYAQACAALPGYSPVPTTVYRIPSNASQNRGEITYTAGKDLEICRSSEVDKSSYKGLNIHRENGEWRCYDVYGGQKTDDNDGDKVSWYRCQADDLASTPTPLPLISNCEAGEVLIYGRCIEINYPTPQPLPVITPPPAIKCSAGFVYNATQKKCIEINPVVPSVPSVGGGSSGYRGLEGYQNFNLR